MKNSCQAEERKDQCFSDRALDAEDSLSMPEGFCKGQMGAGLDTIVASLTPTAPERGQLRYQEEEDTKVLPVKK